MVFPSKIEMFNNSKLNIWNNQRSEYQTFSKDCQVYYFNVKDDVDFMERFTTSFKDQESDIFQYNPVINTHGKSNVFYDENEVIFCYLGFSIIFKGKYC